MGGAATRMGCVDPTTGMPIRLEEFAARMSNFTTKLESHTSVPNLWTLRDDVYVGGTRGRFIVPFLSQEHLRDYETYVYICGPHDWWQVALAYGIHAINKTLPDDAPRKRVAIVWSDVMKSPDTRRGTHTVYIDNARDALGYGAEYYVLGSARGVPYTAGRFRTEAELDAHLVHSNGTERGDWLDATEYVKKNISFPRSVYLNREDRRGFFAAYLTALGSNVCPPGLEKVPKIRGRPVFDEAWITADAPDVMVGLARSNVAGALATVRTKNTPEEEQELADLVKAVGDIPLRVVTASADIADGPDPARLPYFPSDPFQDGLVWNEVVRAARDEPQRKFLFVNTAGRRKPEEKNPKGGGEIKF